MGAAGLERTLQGVEKHRERAPAEGVSEAMLSPPQAAVQEKSPTGLCLKLKQPVSLGVGQWLPQTSGTLGPGCPDTWATQEASMGGLL